MQTNPNKCPTSKCPPCFKIWGNNDIITFIFCSLKASSQPDILGSSVVGFDEIYKKLKTFVHQQHLSTKLVQVMIWYGCHGNTIVHGTWLALI